MPNNNLPDEVWIVTEDAKRLSDGKCRNVVAYPDTLGSIALAETRFLLATPTRINADAMREALETAHQDLLYAYTNSNGAEFNSRLRTVMKNILAALHPSQPKEAGEDV